MMPLIGEQEPAIAALETFKSIYPLALATRMAAKLGLESPHEDQWPLIESALKLLAQEQVDFTIFWRRLSHWAAHMDGGDLSVVDLFVDRDTASAWLGDFRALHYATGASDGAAISSRMLRTNPKFVLRNHLGELAIRAAKTKDFSVLQQLQGVLSDPYAEHPEHEAWAGFAPDWAAGIEISCSS
jgi:uncharacterized protein YdiU (UPF0061 family)